MTRLMALTLALAALGGCTYGLSLPGDAPAPEGPLEVGKVQLRERKSLVPVAVRGAEPPPTEHALSAAQCATLSQGGGTLDGCVTAEITCGETVIGHTVGGAKQFDSAFYAKKFCTPDTTDHDGGDERVYRLKMPEGDWHARITLDTPCADLDVAAILWNRDDCPSNAHIINRCEMMEQRGTARESIDLVSQGSSQWLVVVEGKDDQEGAFGLSVQCFEGLY